MNKIKTKKGVWYFASYFQARDVARWIGGRVVDYDMGYAAQYYYGGPYFPQKEVWGNGK